ncbi:MAG TPA: hypothetical protein VM053_02720 [Gemmatimonadaceae bacterium]|nr:hypothetical protein [Gemmatimonadaceae bacterium]
MSKLSPYRSLPPERRLALVTHVMKASREGRDTFIQRLVERGGGFRAVTLRTWPIDKLAKEIVRMKAESANDELDLLQLMYVDLEPGIQTTFLDAAGVKHENGKMPDDLEPPYADKAGVEKGVAAVREKHGDDGEHYLRTIAKYSHDGWPGIGELVPEAVF